MVDRFVGLGGKEDTIFEQEHMIFVVYQVWLQSIMFALSSEVVEQQRRQFQAITTQQFSQLYSDPQEIGKGSYGLVMKAKDKDGKYVAIKYFLKEAIRYMNQIIREIKNLRRLNHTNILKFEQCYVLDGESFVMVTEYCCEGSLNQYIKTGLTENEKLKLCLQIVEGLAYAHQQHIVHRDLKPDNILIGFGGVAKIGDFGCSLQMKEENQVMSSHVGSPAYMDGRVRAGSYDQSVDIYSLGMVFISIFKGKGIYDDCRNMSELQRKKSRIQRNFDDEMENQLQGIPQILAEIIKSCLAQDHTRRPKSSDIRKTLKAYFTSNKVLISTNDEVQEQEQSVISEINNMSIGLINFYQGIENIRESEQAKLQITSLLVKYMDNFNKINCIQTLKYVKEGTKAQFSFLFTFYYEYCLEEIALCLRGESNNNKIVNYLKIEDQSINEFLDIITNQLERIKPFFKECTARARGLFKLMDERAFMPERFKEMVLQATQRSINFSQFDSNSIRSDLKLFYDRRIKKEYNSNKEKDSQLDENLGKLESLITGFN